jgi:peptidoglycan/xylan/chitin deacetylase (PgdA/CDA1 family)
MTMWRDWLKTHSASVLTATRLDRVVAEVTGDRGRPLVLGYHRVVEAYRPDPNVTLPSMEISVAMLEAQIDWVAQRYTLVSLDELASRLDAADPDNASLAAITIDDGYRDAYEIAFPLFRRKGVPVAFFIVTDLVGSSEVPIFDRLYYQLAQGYADEGGVSRACWARLNRLGLSESRRLRLRRAVSPYDALQELLIALPQSVTRTLVAELEAERPLPPTVAERVSCLDWDMLRSMAKAGMVIGSHTRNHAFVNHEAPAVAYDETVGAKRRLETELGRAVPHFAYPAGHFDAGAVRAVAAAGYRYAYTICRHGDATRPLLTIPRKILGERSCADGAGRFSSSVMAAQISGFFDLVSPRCALDHGHSSARPVAAAC